MEYLTCCVNSTVEKIDAMIEVSKEISYRTARKMISPGTMDEWAQTMSYDTNRERGGLRLKNDWAVSYFKSRYGGRICIYIVHSAIEYIFI